MFFRMSFMEPTQTPLPGGTAAVLPGVRVVQIAISQLFKMVDLLTYPDSVRAQAFLDTIRDPNAMRRAINRRKAFRLGNLGSMRPVAVETGDRFWRGSLPNLRQPGVSPLFFLPFELPLRSRLAGLSFVPGSSLEAALATAGGLVVNWQVEGRLRIYPPGTGVVQISVTPSFREDVDVDVVARIAQNLGDLLFVDPEGQERPPNDFFFDVIDQVEKSLFLEGTGDRLWTPPHTVFSLRDAQGFDPEPRLAELARLMSLAPGNEQRAGFLESRLREALRSPHWQSERTLAVAGQGVALLITGLEPRERRAHRLDLLAQTRELVSAAAYAEQAFIEDLDRIVGLSQLDESWLPGRGIGFDYLRRLVETLLQVRQAISSIRFLKNHPVGILNAFAKEVWTYSNPVKPSVLRQRLEQVADWYESRSDSETEKEIEDLRDGIRRIQEIEPLFPYPAAWEDEPSDPREPGASRKVRIFYSYAHDDERLRKRLVQHLSGLQSAGLVEGWDDRQIGAGTEWAGQISKNLEKADLILFLVSPSFMASTYSQDVEVKRAMERHEEGTARVIPVIVRPVDWATAPFAKLEALPEKGKPVTRWPTRDEGFLSIALGIRRVVEEVRSRSSGS